MNVKLVQYWWISNKFDRMDQNCDSSEWYNFIMGGETCRNTNVPTGQPMTKIMIRVRGFYDS